MTLADIKGIVRQDADQSFRYSRFLKLLQPEIDKPHRDPNCDLWFFSDNTTFCIDSAKIIRDEILEHGVKYRIIQQDKNADVKLNFIDIRRKFAAYCVFLYATLESFSHEVNIFYECGLQRFDVKISKIASRLREVRRGASLNDHLRKIDASQRQNVIDEDIKFLFEYRNAIVHGYVFPISGTSSGIFLTKKPREVVTFNSCDLELMSFCKRIYDKIFDFINEGWKCFSNDELGQPCEIGQHYI